MTRRSAYTTLTFATLFLICVGSSILIQQQRPLHHDEAVLAFHFANEVLRTGHYHYDPTNYHGPLYYYVGALALKLGGDSTLAMRLPVILCRAFTTLLPLIVLPHISLLGIWIFGLLIVTSPFYWFFSGSFAFMESFLDLFLLMTCFGLIKFVLTKHIRSWVWIFIGVTGMALTKETYMFFVVALCVTLLCTDLLRKNSLTPYLKIMLTHRWVLLFMTAACGLVYTAVYTEWFTFPEGIFNSFKSFLVWKNTAIKSGHEKPSSYFLAQTFRYEVPLWSLLLISLFWIWRSRLAQFFFVGALIHFLIYSLVPYKTPWCLPTALAPFFVIPILGLSYISKRSLIIFFLISTGWFGWHLYQFSTQVIPQDTPFSYVHTDLAYNELDALLNVMDQNPAAVKASGAVYIHQSYWPLPYYFRKFKSIGFYPSTPPLDVKQLSAFQILMTSPVTTPQPLLDQLKTTHTILHFKHFINDPIYLLIKHDLVTQLTPHIQSLIHHP